MFTLFKKKQQPEIIPEIMQQTSISDKQQAILILNRYNSKEDFLYFVESTKTLPSRVQWYLTRMQMYLIQWDINELKGMCNRNEW